MCYYNNMIDVKHIKRCSVSALLIPVMLCVLLWSPATYAARCGASNEEDIDERYDRAVRDFAEKIEDEGVESTIRDIRAEIDRARDAASNRAEAINVAVRRLRGEINNLDDAGDQIIDDFRKLSRRSRFEDCEDEVADKAGDLREHIREKISDFRDDLHDLDSAADSLHDRSRTRRSEVRAPVWHWGQQAPTNPPSPPSNNNRNNNRERENTARQPSSNQDGTPRQTNQNTAPAPSNPSNSQTSAEIYTEIQQLFTQIQALIVKFAQAKQRERANL